MQFDVPSERWSVEWVAETGSTNADLLAQASDGAPEGLVLIAGSQRTGRGRLDRTWDAPPGSGLLVSVLLRPQLELSQMHLVVIAVALAAADAAEDVTGVRPLLKWPNDLLGVAADGSVAKLAGILAESGAPGPSPVTNQPSPYPPLVVGMGLNLHRPDALPADMGARAIYLDELAPGGGGEVSREEVAKAWLGSLTEWYQATSSREGRAELINAWKADLATIGREVRAYQHHGDIAGQAIDVTEHGALVIRTGSGTVEVHAGDVIHLR